MIKLTDTAIAALEEAIDPTDFVRIGVVAGGCSGFSYQLEIEEDKNEDDVIVEFGNIKVSLNPVSAEMLSDTIVDYVETIAQSGFEFKNTKATRTCGCGTSFQQECPKVQ